MKPEEYKTMYELESNYWYFVALRNFIFYYFKDQYPEGKDVKMLDAGCGTRALLQNFMKYGDLLGIDISEHALFYCKKRNLNRIMLGFISNLPFKDNQFDLVTSVDVLCCLQEAEDTIALREIYRVLKVYGRLILNLPAYKFLMSEHDKATLIKKRYSKAELILKLELSGFKIQRITYETQFFSHW